MATRLASDFLTERVFTFQEVKTRYGLTDNAAWRTIQYAKSRRQIGAVRKGLYFVIPPDADAVAYRPDPFLVASKADPSGVLAYHAALELHGVAYSSFYEVAIAVPKWRRGFEVGDVRIRFVEAPTTFGVQTTTREGVEVRVTDRERTLVDGCDRPVHAGGVEELLRSVATFPSVDHERILEYVRAYDRKALAAKVGWVLDRFSDQWGFPEGIRQGLQALRPRGAVTLEAAERKRMDRDWGVLLPSNLEARLTEV